MHLFDVYRWKNRGYGDERSDDADGWRNGVEDYKADEYDDEAFTAVGDRVSHRRHALQDG